MIRIARVVLAAGAAVAFAGAALAAETNFASGNAAGAASAAENKKYQRGAAAAAAAGEKKEGFWDREWKRSGLSDSPVHVKRIPNVFGGVADFFKRKETEYRTRNPQTDG